MLEMEKPWKVQVQMQIKATYCDDIGRLWSYSFLLATIYIYIVRKSTKWFENDSQKICIRFWHQFNETLKKIS